MSMYRVAEYINRQGNRVGVYRDGKAYHIDVIAMTDHVPSERSFAAQLQAARADAERALGEKLHGPVSSGGSQWSRTKVYVTD